MSKLLIVWKSDSYHNIELFIKPFALNSKKKEWFHDVEVLIWGISSLRVKGFKSAQNIVKEMISTGIKVGACKYCADKTRATKKLESLGVNVFYAGEYLSEKMKDPEYEVITI